ncbi:hypothetical protein UlMin_032167 [Ulmus minor]
MENENTSVQCTQTKASIPQMKAMWDVDSISKLCDLCVKEVKGGHRPGTHFSKVGWENLVKKFNSVTGRNYDKTQLKNKWDALKIDWKIWKQLIGKETGLGWNIKKRIVDACDEWWGSKLQLIYFYYFCLVIFKGITLDMIEKLDKMFMNITTTEEYAWTPSSGVLPFESGKNCLDNLNILENSGDSEDPTLQEKHERKNKKRPNEEAEKEVHKSNWA